MDKAGLRYTRRDNTFTGIEDVPEAQRIMEQMKRLTWPQALQAMARRLNPAHSAIFDRGPMDSYWTVHQSEWACLPVGGPRTSCSTAGRPWRIYIRP